MQVQQTSIDSLEVEYYHGVALCEFSWRGKARGPVMVLESSKVRAAIGKRKARPVDAVSKLGNDSLVVLSAAGEDVLSRLGPTHLYEYYQVFDTGYAREETLAIFNDAKAIREILTGKSASEVEACVYATVDGMGLFTPSSPIDALPINHPIYMEASDRFVDVSRALAHLEAHPAVVAIRLDRGRPGSYDHVPSFLRMVVKLPDKVRSEIEAKSRVRLARYIHKGERYAAGSSEFERELTWELKSNPGAYGDPLGLSAFARAREEYQEPRDESDEYWS